MIIYFHAMHFKLDLIFLSRDNRLLMNQYLLLLSYLDVQQLGTIKSYNTLLIPIYNTKLNM